MNYKTHVIGGISASLIANYLIVEKSIITLPENNKLIVAPILIAGAVVGSLLPDLDHSKSFLGGRLKIISKPINLIFGHRGITHSLSFWITAIITLLLYGKNYVSDGSYDTYLLLIMGIGIGGFSHLFLDSLTKLGIPIFYPFSKYRLSLMSFTTGGIGEKVFSLFLLLITAYAIIL